MIRKISIGFALCLFLFNNTYSVAEQAEEEKTSLLKTIPITVTTPKLVDLEMWEFSVGQIEAKIAPLIAAEVAGRLTSVNADVGDPIKKGQLLAEIDDQDYKLDEAMAKTEINRIKALIHAQRLKSKRHHDLLKKKVSNQSFVDDVDAQLGALKAEYASAQVKLQKAQRDIAQTRIISPIDGRVDDTQVSKGDYVKIGAPLMRIGNLQWLKVRLPYPETLLSSLQAGLPVHLTSPSVPDITLKTTISEVRPSVTFGSRSAQIIVNVKNPGGWQPGATVVGEVRTEQHKNAILLPEISVVLRPIGSVVYVISDDKAQQRIVTTGYRKNGQVEILSGLKVNEPVALDGAGFLSDNAIVEVKVKVKVEVKVKVKVEVKAEVKH